MILKYTYGTSGSYSFTEETTAIQISTAYEYDSRGRPDKQNQTWQINAYLQASTQAEITTAINTLVSALSTADGTLTLYINNGTTKSSHELTNCHLQNVDYPEGTGSEYANHRTVNLTVNGYADITKDDDIVSFQESLSLSGGGSRFILLETLNGTPKKFTQKQKTIYRATQQGSAVGKTDYPTISAAMFPGQEVEENPRVSKNHTYNEMGEERYSISWSYEFASATEFANTSPSKWALTAVEV